MVFRRTFQDDPAAKKLLATLTAESITLDGTLAEIDAALAEAQSRLEQAQQQEEQRETRAAASEARIKYKRLAELAAVMDEHSLALSTAASEVKRTIDELHSAGFPMPTSAQAQTFLSLCVSTMVQRLEFLPRGYEHRYLSPREKRSFTSVLKGWSDAMMPQLDRTLHNGTGKVKEQEAVHV